MEIDDILLILGGFEMLFSILASEFIADDWIILVWFALVAHIVCRIDLTTYWDLSAFPFSNSKLQPLKEVLSAVLEISTFYVLTKGKKKVEKAPWYYNIVLDFLVGFLVAAYFRGNQGTIIPFACSTPLVFILLFIPLFTKSQFQVQVILVQSF